MLLINITPAAPFRLPLQLCLTDTFPSVCWVTAPCSAHQWQKHQGGPSGKAGGPAAPSSGQIHHRGIPISLTGWVGLKSSSFPGPAWAPGVGDAARVSLSLGLKPGSLQMPLQQPRAGSLYPGSPVGPALPVTPIDPLVPSLLPQCQVSWAGRHRTSTVLTRLEMLQVFLAPLPAWRASLIF